MFSPRLETEGKKRGREHEWARYVDQLRDWIWCRFYQLCSHAGNISVGRFKAAQEELDEATIISSPKFLKIKNSLAEYDSRWFSLINLPLTRHCSRCSFGSDGCLNRTANNSEIEEWRYELQCRERRLPAGTASDSEPKRNGTAFSACSAK